jgi:hypothetical protein
MQERGLQNPLLAYAAANNIEAETLSVSESVWRDQGGCIARRNYVPFQSEGVYGPQLMTTPFDFGVGAAAIAAAAVAASTGTGVLVSPEI